MNKLTEFCALLQTNLFDVIFVVETWLSDSVTDGMLTGGYHTTLSGEIESLVVVAF